VSTHDELRELLGAYALDAVDEREAAEVRAHLATCTACAAEVDEHHEITAMLANSGGDAPAHLWERIEAQLGTSTRAPAPAAGRSDADELAARRAADAPRPAAARRVRLLAVAAVTILVVALGVLVVRLDDRVGRLQGASLEQQLVSAAHRALGDPTAQHVALDSSTSSGTVAQIAVLRSGTAFLVNDGLPALPDGRTYQLWGSVGGRLVSLGLLGARPTAVSFDVGRPGLVTSFAITDEHAGGVVQSTHRPVAASAA
jgi:Anti-sigma-K factor rskA/Putative zinc-finger